MAWEAAPVPVPRKTGVEHECALMTSVKTTYLSKSEVRMIIIGHVYHQKGEAESDYHSYQMIIRGLPSDKKPHLTAICFHLYLFLSSCCSKKKCSGLGFFLFFFFSFCEPGSSKPAVSSFS